MPIWSDMCIGVVLLEGAMGGNGNLCCKVPNRKAHVYLMIIMATTEQNLNICIFLFIYHVLSELLYRQQFIRKDSNGTAMT